MRVAERILPLQGGRNFRDLGGYRTIDDKQVVWGRIYRSGVMANLTGEDVAYLRRLGVDVVCDFRSREEIAREPSALAVKGGLEYVTFDYSMGMESIAGVARAKTREEAVAAFAQGYLSMATMLKPHFTDLFERLARSETPLAMNCSAGKDRTGVASALLLSILGVPRETVVADYALSEKIIPPDSYVAAIRGQGGAKEASVLPPDQAVRFAQMSDPALRVLMGTDADVMRLTLKAMDDQHGGPLGFAKTQFGVDDAMVTVLRRLYTV